MDIFMQKIGLRCPKVVGQENEKMTGNERSLICNGGGELQALIDKNISHGFFVI